MLKNIFLFVSLIILFGCSYSTLKSKNLYSIESGYAVNHNFTKLMSNDTEIDTVAYDIKKLLIKEEFQFNTNISFGLLPYRGHIVHLSFYINKKHRVSGYIEISKRKFLVKFYQTEITANSNQYLTSKQDLYKIKIFLIEIKKLLKTKYPTRSIKVSSFIN